MLGRGAGKLYNPLVITLLILKIVSTLEQDLEKVSLATFGNSEQRVDEYR